MENKNRGSSIFLGVIGVATLVVAIIGATFAYFSASTGSETNAIAVESAALGLDFTDSNNTNLKTNLIPAAENIATYAALNQTGTGTAKNNQCIDDNANEVCGVYEFTVSNSKNATLAATSVTGGTLNSATQYVTFLINVTTNGFTNLKYKVYEGTADSLTASGSTALATGTFGTANSSTTLALGTEGPNSNAVKLGTTTTDCFKTYTMVIWLDETNSDQSDASVTQGTTDGTSGNTNESGKSFAAGVTITSGSGVGVTGVIAAAQG